MKDPYVLSHRAIEAAKAQERKAIIDELRNQLGHARTRRRYAKSSRAEVAEYGYIGAAHALKRAIETIKSRGPHS